MYNESYSPFLIIFSILIAIFSSYTTLVLVGRILDGKRAKKKIWLFTGAFVMGSGIFSMHFIGMIAFHSNHSITVNGFLLVLAFISSLLSSYAAFYLLQAQPLTRTKILISGLSVGLGIVLLHYIATFAVHEKVAIQFKSIFFTLSILISLAFSFVAIKMFVTMRSKPQKSNFNILINSVVLGVTVSAMHYTGMKATNFLDSDSNASSSMIDALVLGNIISYSIIFIMMATLITAYHDHRILITERRLIKQLKESELRYRRLVEQSPEAILVHNGQTILFVNDACLRITHATSKNELIGKQVIDFIDPINREVLKKHIESIEMEGRLEISQQKIIAVDDSIVDVEIAWIGIMYDNQPAIQLVLRDITEQNKLKRELEEKKQRYSSLFEYNPDPVLSVDCQGNFKEVNSIVWDLLGYSKEELLNMSFHSLIDPSYLDLAISIFYKVLGGKPQNYEVVVIGKKGYKLPANLTLIPIIIDKNVTGVFCIAKDLTKEKESLQRIEELAYTDQLTGLFNRTSFNNYFREVLTKTKEDKTSIVILMLDFDNFKDVNDILGHNIGDLYLQRVSKRLRECLHQQDKIARIGGDEFIILLEDVTKDEAGNIARTILNVMNHAIHIEGHDITVTLSIGISINSDSNTDVNTMIKQADLAMYHAKDQGKNNYQFFTNELNERALRKVKLESALRRAIEQEELKLHYQPLVEIQTGKLVGVEALLRWNPIFGSVAPSEFIPIAEDTGLIVEIGEWVIEEVCRQINSWQRHYSTVVPVSLNVSARQFKEAEFTKTVKQIIQDAHINPSLLEIEITESVMMDIEESVQIIQELRDFGVKNSN
ncbi:bifunctional diguanylate cyclase/phosphodiesterase [Paucisalibacillus globulus]|uniref:bifunctional diguanylate cyclase/phosphodiesterase n=1 Tax=Paucisalibacillus globulus TaxID=351095 RepID=UPI000428DF3B|nr:diguanylate cyclase [Paucisalibacillus globulus]